MRSARGWSLVELVMVIIIVGTLAAFIGPLLLKAVSAYDMTEGTVGAYAKMRYAMERIAREVREVRRSPADTANLDISSMTAINFTFYKADGTQVAITFAAPNVTLNYVGTASGTLTDQVSAFTFAYYQQDGTTAATNAANVAYVQASLTLTEGTNNFANRQRFDLRNPQ
jgi:type II secretory pathway pseudopilin PulG